VVAQLVILLCLVWQRKYSKRQGRFAVSTPMVLVAAGALLVLLAYAVVRRDAVFLAGQFINLLIVARLSSLRRPRDAEPPDAAAGFPKVAPDSAERVR
jgi:lipid-A-disaccharide synthase-like uncharacterized protein